MADQYLSEIRIVSFNFAPRGWAFCNGQTLPINQNQALFSLLGTVYGGNGVNTFQLPDLQGRIPLHFNGTYPLGAKSGEAAHTLTISEIPSHNHVPVGNKNLLNSSTPVGNRWAASTLQPYRTDQLDQTLAPNAVGNTGASQPHDNLPPLLVLNFIIALQGIFPSRN